MGQVTELSAVKYENLLLKAQAVQSQFTLLQQQYKALSDEQVKILAEMRAEVGAAESDQYDPRTRSFFTPEVSPAPSPAPAGKLVKVPKKRWQEPKN